MIENVNPGDVGRWSIRPNQLSSSKGWCNFTLHIRHQQVPVIENPPIGPSEGNHQIGLIPTFTNVRYMERVRFANHSVGNTVSFHCPAKGTLFFIHVLILIYQGFPKPKIQWFKNGSQISRHHSNLHKWTLTLQYVGRRDSGNYTCLIFNRLGQVNFTYHLSVQGIIKMKTI